MRSFDFRNRSTTGSWPPDVLGQPDRGHRVEAGLAHVAVVAVAHLGQIGQALIGDGLLRPGGLLAGQRHPMTFTPRRAA